MKNNAVGTVLPIGDILFKKWGKGFILALKNGKPCDIMETVTKTLVPICFAAALPLGKVEHH